jgi:hypothetical protein
MKFYTGIGSRSVDEKMGNEMKSIAMSLNDMGYILRSGNADGSDQWFAKGVKDDKAQIWLPWKEFNVSFQILHSNHTYKVIMVNDREAFESIDKFHPNPNKLGQQGIKLMGRNYRQIVGLNEPNSQFVICWTPDGEMVGGTAQAWRIALHYHIPVYNMFNMTNNEILKEIEKLNLLH